MVFGYRHIFYTVRVPYEVNAGHCGDMLDGGDQTRMHAGTHAQISTKKVSLTKEGKGSKARIMKHEQRYTYAHTNIQGSAQAHVLGCPPHTFIVRHSVTVLL